MHAIVESLLKKFVEANELQSLSLQDQFEHFACFVCLSKEGLAPKEFSRLVTDPGEEGIDFAGAFANGRFLESPDDVDDLVQSNTDFSVSYVFGQAKTGDKWNGVLEFTRAVEGFFSGKQIGQSAVIANCRAIHTRVLENAASLSKNPEISCFFLTTGNDVPEDQDPNSFAPLKYMNELKSDLDRMALFSQINTPLLGSGKIQQYYRAAVRSCTVTIDFAERLDLPNPGDGAQAYLGLLPAGELIKLLTSKSDIEIDPSGLVIEPDLDLRAEIFEDNVRDFQGTDNKVNSAMGETIRNKPPEYFALLNNGITVITRKLKTLQRKFTLEDYQIVNGAQTSNVLFRNIQHLESHALKVPVKIIQSEDDALIDQIVLANNSQTPVSVDQLNSRASIERNIETLFDSRPVVQRLYYERRLGQYNDKENVAKARIIDRAILVRSAAAAFLNEPHTATGYQSTLLSRIENQDASEGLPILRSTDNPLFYYCAASIYYRLDLYFKTARIPAIYKPTRWHLIHLIASVSLGRRAIDLSTDKLNSKLEELINQLWDDQSFNQKVADAVDILRKSGIPFTREALKRATATGTFNSVANL